MLNIMHKNGTLFYSYVHRKEHNFILKVLTLF